MDMRVYTFPPESPCFFPRKSVTWRMHAWSCIFCHRIALISPQKFNAHEKHARHARTSPNMLGHARRRVCTCLYMRVHASTCLYMPLHAGKCMDMRLYFFLLESPCFPPRKSCAWHMHSVHMACTWRIFPTCVNMVSEKKTGRFWGKHSPHPIFTLSYSMREARIARARGV